MPLISAQDAVDELYRIAVAEGKKTSTARLDTLAAFCLQELRRRGLTGVEREAAIPGAGRAKSWDVAWRYDGKYRLGISLKSLLRNLPAVDAPRNGMPCAAVLRGAGHERRCEDKAW